MTDTTLPTGTGGTGGTDRAAGAGGASPPPGRAGAVGGRRLPALDGLRALAIALVVGLHAGVPGFAGGSLGVTIFFVLSGFLITSLLMRPGALRRGSVGRFYWRRFLRLFPALAVVVAAVTAYAVVALEGEERRFQLVQSLASITYTNNFLMGRGATTDDYGLLGQTWSLGVEEQYYLLWPLVLLLVTTALIRSGARAGAVLAMAGLVVAWRFHVSEQGLAAHVGMSLDTQVDGLLIGSALAIVLPAVRHRLVRHQALLTLGAAAAVLLLLAESAVVSTHTALPGDVNYAIVALATAVLITRLVLPGHPEKGVGRGQAAMLHLFTLRPVVWVGVISYSLYLWHRVVFEILDDQMTIETTVQKLMVAPVALGLAVGAAALSYYAVERPFLRMKDRVPGSSRRQAPRRPEVRA